MQNKELVTIMQKRRKGNGISVWSILSEDLFIKFYHDVQEEGRSESGLIAKIIKDYYQNKTRKNK
jgi:hypothetical protein